jgi:SAM-dependent methyltransferase
MASTTIETRTTDELTDLKGRLKATWMTGDYDAFSRYMEDGAKQFFDRLAVKPGTRVLDVACGSGQLALIAAWSGAVVTGCDISTNWLEAARARARAEHLQATFEEGDAESLPYRDAEFDVVVSLIGAMFAPRPHLVAAELTRVCRPGGMIAMANWTPEGFIGQMFKIIAKHIAPSGMPSPVLWGDPGMARERLKEGVAEIRFSRRQYRFTYPFAPGDTVEFFRVNYGPMARAFASLDASGQAKLRRELVELWSAHNQATDGTTDVDGEYLEVIATRAANGGKTRTSIRAALLADRVEQGAATLAGFVAGLSDTNWRKAVSTTDTRSVGTVVHHIASVYDIEIQLAQAIAAGHAVTDVTWEAVAKLNADHAREHSTLSKWETLALLREKSRKAADAVRGLTDEELDRAAPFSLSYGAPMTAQFAIEDHALRHSWHHLARIKAAVQN